MTTLVEPIYLEALRVLYVLSVRGWPAVLTALGVLALAATFVFAAWRFLNAGGPHGAHTATPGRENA